MKLQNTIYIDSVFLLNLVMDLYLLKLTGRILGKTATYPRILLGSLAGALGYCMVLCIPGISYGGRILFGMLPIGMLMIKITYRTNKFTELLRIMGYIYFFSFLIGGFMVFLKGRFPFFKTYENSVLVLALAGFIGYAIFMNLIAWWEKKRSNCFRKVVLDGDKGKVAVWALVDTGNGLVEPVSQKPVAVLDEDVWKKMIRWMKPEKFKVIPYHSIGKERGFLNGYEVGSLTVKGNGEEKHFENVIIAVFKGKVSGKDSYQMILPLELS